MLLKCHWMECCSSLTSILELSAACRVPGALCARSTLASFGAGAPEDYFPARSETKLRDRGLLKEGYFADITIFDPETIRDRATYENSTQLSEGVKYVFVNGKLEYDRGNLTGANAGRILLGPGVEKRQTQTSPGGANPSTP